jgi:3-hydroxymyristoyl/3-hydroxydecanoyl-(acyl carrier protein) dehydratase
VTAPIADGLTLLAEQVDAGGWRARLRVEAASRVFDGHFEGEPILPGIVHLLVLRHALRALRGPDARLAELPSVRLRRVVRPGEVLEVVVSTPGEDGRCRFDVRAGEAVVAAGTAVARSDG